MAVAPLSLKAIPNFEELTAAESLIFEGGFEEKSFREEESVLADETLLVVREGKIRLEVETAAGRLPFATVETGGLLGEMAFFEPEPVGVAACVESDAICFVIDRPSLKNTFRYSRTGAVKFMVSFARGLSHKIRSANEVLQKIPPEILDRAGAVRPSQLDPVDLQRLMGLALSRSYGDGDVLFAERDVSRELFVIGEGEVEIAKDDPSGETITLARLGPGDFFGEMAFVDDKPRSAAAVARSELRVHMLPSGSLEKALEYNVGTALYLTSVICKIMARRLNVTLKRLGAK
jgi:CRP-like cAMP-binding protein